MIPPDSPFAIQFDSIELDPARAPTAEAIERALAMCTPKDAPMDAPGFYLLDDSEGRFEIDHDLGIVSLKDESLLEREAGSVRAARLRVIEPSGATYELELRLRLTGRIPQLVGGEENDFLLGPNAPPAAAAKKPTRIVRESIAATRGALGAIAVDARFGEALTAPSLPAFDCQASIALADALPSPNTADAAWSV